MKKSSAKSAAKQAKDKLLPKLSLFFFGKPALTAGLWLILVVFGIASYTTFLKREGFPTINVPFVVVTGSYAVNDPAKVDQKLAAPVSQAALDVPKATTVQTQSEGNFFSAFVQFEESVQSADAEAAVKQAVNQKVDLPEGAQLQFSAPKFGVTGGDSKKIDVTISMYSDKNTSLQQLVAKANAAAAFLNKQDVPEAENFFVQSPFEQVTNPVTGQPITVQRTFDRYGERDNNKTDFHQSVIIAVTGVENADATKLYDQVEAALTKLNNQPQFEDYNSSISASYAPAIRQEISELQRVLLEGLIAVLIVGSIVIAVRASVITVVSMITVLATVIGLLFLIGYSLNVITLFALILGLSLIVDDTIIMVEAIDASRKREKNARAVVHEATRKISRAMVAATLTAALSFTPLLFVGGILGSFIRAIPITIISALLISLLVALIFIPLFSRFLLLGKKQLGEKGVKEFAAGFEQRIARWLARPMLWAQSHRKREVGVGLTAVGIGLGFVIAAGFIFQHVTFNIFPPTKDTNQLGVTLTFPTETTVQQAESITTKADRITAKTLGQYFEYGSYYGMATAQSATLYVNITPYEERTTTAPELVTKLESAFADFDKAQVKVFQLDVGPPGSNFTVNVDATERAKAQKLADDLAVYLQSLTLTRPSGEVAKVTEASVSNGSVYTRVDNQPVISVNAEFDGDDTTTLTTLAQNAINDEFTPEKLATYGLDKDAISFDLGEEQQNQDSFKTLALAFPIVLAVIYLLLALQFRSLLQPLLIFLAIPFSLFGVTLGLFLTDNAFSFFAMLGFFALIGLSIKNTILLTDYANQSRRAGMGPVDAAVEALSERFRPLIATSLTAIFSLIPLAIISPFWQGLAVVLIFGLASSTFLVVTVFPYYYLGAEYMRARISRRMFGKWFVINAAVVVLLVLVKLAALIMPALLLLNLGWLTWVIIRRRSQTA